MERQVGAGIRPETPGGLSVGQPASAQPLPLLGGVSDITASQDDDLTLGYQTQPLRGQHDEETGHTAEARGYKEKQNQGVHAARLQFSCVLQLQMSRMEELKGSESLWGGKKSASSVSFYSIVVEVSERRSPHLSEIPEYIQHVRLF